VRCRRSRSSRCVTSCSAIRSFKRGHRIPPLHAVAVAAAALIIEGANRRLVVQQAPWLLLLLLLLIRMSALQ
jgi:hypothetical protein